MSRLPQYIDSLRGLGHKAQLVTKGRQEMLSITVRIGREQNQKTSSTEFDKAAFRVSLSSDVPSDASFFHAVLYVPVSAVSMSPKAVPVSTADAAHCCSVTKGTLFLIWVRCFPSSSTNGDDAGCRQRK